jgi:CRP-like cAMP-binding protein
MRIQGQSIGAIARRIGIVRSYPAKCEIVHQNAPAMRVYEVISGTVCTCKVLKNGRRQIAGFYFSGDVFGLESVDRSDTWSPQKRLPKLKSAFSKSKR